MTFEVVDDYDVSYQAVQILSIKPFQKEPNVFELLFEYEIKEIPPGRYRLKVTFTDTLAQQTLSTSSSFVYK